MEAVGLAAVILTGCGATKEDEIESDSGQISISKDSGDTASVTVDNLIAADHAILTIMTEVSLNPLASSTSQWSTGVTNFLSNSNSALTSGTPNEDGAFATSIVASGLETLPTTLGGYSEVTFFIMLPGSDAGVLSFVGAAELYRSGQLIDLSEVGYDGAYVMVGVVQGFDDLGLPTGQSVCLKVVTEDGVESELLAYYTANSDQLVVTVDGSTEMVTPAPATDLSAQNDLAAVVATLISDRVNVPRGIFQ